MWTPQKIVVMGLGYVGLPTAAMFASRKIKVLGVDVSEQVVETVNNGNVHIVEPDLEIVVGAAVKEGYLRAATSIEPADAFLLAVPTPLEGVNREPDLAFVEAATRVVAEVLKPGDLVILESTSPVGTTEKVADWISEVRPDLRVPKCGGDKGSISIAHCPERVLPGRVMLELAENDRIIGGITHDCAEKAVALYKTFVRGECVIASSSRTAELTKLTENSFRDVNIAFANELSMVCGSLGVDVWELISLANLHPRVDVLNPGTGVGGHCIAVDPWFIVSSSPESARLIRTAREVNDSKPHWVVDRVFECVRERADESAELDADGLTIACYGVAFKADIDDLRESPALEVVEKIASRHSGTVAVVEPYISDIPHRLAHLSNVKFVRGAEPITAHVHALLVAHKHFKDLDWHRVGGVVLDFQGLM